MTLIDYHFIYKENAKVKEYVDKFARCHRMTVEDTLKQAIVQGYIDDEVKKNV